MGCFMEAIFFEKSNEDKNWPIPHSFFDLSAFNLDGKLI